MNNSSDLQNLNSKRKFELGECQIPDPIYPLYYDDNLGYSNLVYSLFTICKLITTKEQNTSRSNIVTIIYIII